MKKKSKFFLLVFGVVFALSVVGFKIKAGTNDNIIGWLWGGSEDGAAPPGIGWVNTNCASKVDTNGDNTLDTALKVCNGGANAYVNCNGPGAVACPGASCVDACTISNYGINLPSGDGDITGSAWSENVGWIAFDNSSGFLNGCPAGNGACSARKIGTNLEGWARIVAIAQAGANAGGWLGWVKLNGNGVSGYGVSVNSGTGKLNGSAWSDELGYVRFDNAFGGQAVGAGMSLPIISNFAIDQITLNPGESLPRSTNVTWTVGGDVSGGCILKDATNATVASGGGNFSGGVNIQPGQANTNFVLECTSSTGTKNDTTLPIANRQVVSGCYNYVCDNASQTCDMSNIGNFRPSASYICTRDCTSNAQCAQSATTNWREVAP